MGCGPFLATASRACDACTLLDEFMCGKGTHQQATLAEIARGIIQAIVDSQR